jgi:hypothetical protein
MVGIAKKQRARALALLTCEGGLVARLSERVAEGTANSGLSALCVKDGLGTAGDNTSQPPRESAAWQQDCPGNDWPNSEV